MTNADRLVLLRRHTRIAEQLAEYERWPELPEASVLAYIDLGRELDEIEMLLMDDEQFTTIH